MAEHILDERGYFWWNDESIPKGHFSPESSIGGVLIVDANGSSRLELDGYLSRNEHPFEGMFGHGQEISLDKCIQGKLKGSGKSVLLLGLRRDGSRFSSNGISYEHFAAEDCLLAYETFPSTSVPLKFSMLSISLTGLEEWLSLRNIEVTRTRSHIVAKHRLPKPDVYDLGDGSLTISYDINGPGSARLSNRTGKLNMVESATLQFKSKEIRSLREMSSEYSMMQDLFILLTGSNYSLEWPELKFGKSSCYHYYQVPQRFKKAPEWNMFWANYTQLRPNFGEIVDTWRIKREEFGPGFYLYLGVRRGMKMYIEHSYVNLVWGLESLHRRKGTGATPGGKIEAKVQRILEQLNEGKDKQWLEKRLKNAAEPSLQERLVEVISMVPLEIDRNSLQIFCKTCADRRNDISHFGGLRHDGDYGDFLTELSKKFEALKYLYHIILLCEIGVEPDLLRKRFFDGPNSHAMQYAFNEAGLVVNSPTADACTG